MSTTFSIEHRLFSMLKPTTQLALVLVKLLIFQAMLVLPILGWIFMPVYIASGVRTMPEYISKRFGGKRLSAAIVILSLINYIFTKIAVSPGLSQS